MNAITYKEVFPLVKANKLWIGNNNGQKCYFVSDNYVAKNIKIGENKRRYVIMGNTWWFTNLDHGQRHERLSLMTMADNKKFNRQIQKHEHYIYQKYNNYDAIEVSEVTAIPSDYDGVMGVPVTVLDKYNPEQFEIVGMAEDNARGFSGGIWDGENPRCVVNGKARYKRVFIKQTVYAQQTATAKKNAKSNCPLCAAGHDAHKSRIWKLDEMDADHVTAWSKGGKSDIKNCQMLCKTHNRAKGNK